MKRNNHYRRNKQSRIGNKAGLAPGTVTYTGEERNFHVVADVLTWDDEYFDEKNGVSIQHIQDDISTSQTRWINVIGIHDTSAIEHLGRVYNFHSLVQEDIAHAAQRPKLDDYEDYLYVVVKMIEFDNIEKHVKTEQLSIILRGNTIISFIEDEGDLFDGLRDRIQKGNMKVRKSGSGYLLYCLLDAIVDNYFVVLERIGDELEETEINLLSNATTSDLSLIHELKHELIFLRKAIWPMREIVGSLSKVDNLHLTGNTSIYLRDVYDHCIHAIDTLETYRDISSGLMDVYLSSLSNKMNVVMKTLTVISTIFIPLTFIVGIYGMNFHNMPELDSQYGYKIIWGIMITIAIGMGFYFKRKRWF
jgi:magnesium transporter